MPDIDIDVIKKQLRDEILAEIQLKPAGVRADSEWSAHANWKSKSGLVGDFEVSSNVTLSDKYDVEKHLTKLREDASSDKLVAVANSLKDMLNK